MINFLKNLFSLVRPSYSVVFLFFNSGLITAQKLSFENIKNYTVDYGIITQGSSGIFELIVKNTDKVPLIISNIKSSCGCTVPEWPKEPLVAGKKYVIKIKYDTNQLGPIAKTLTIQSNDKNSNFRVLKIRGMVKEGKSDVIIE